MPVLMSHHVTLPSCVALDFCNLACCATRLCNNNNKKHLAKSLLTVLSFSLPITSLTWQYCLSGDTYRSAEASCALTVGINRLQDDIAKQP